MLYFRLSDAKAIKKDASRAVGLSSNLLQRRYVARMTSAPIMNEKSFAAKNMLLKIVNITPSKTG